MSDVEPSGPAAPSVLAFAVRGLALALPAGAVRRVLEPPPVRRVPGTPAWFAGVAVVGGRLLPLTDLGAWLGPSGGAVAAEGAGERSDDGPRLLELGAAFGLVGLLVDRVDGLIACRDADAGDIADDDPLGRLDPRRPRARAVVAGGAVRALLDPSALVSSPGFVDLSAPT